MRSWKWPALSKVNTRDAAEHCALLAARAGVDDRCAVGALLADPESRGVRLQRRGVLAQHLGLETLRALVQHRGDGIVDRGGDRAEDKRRDHGRRDELPGGNAGRARDHELEPARQRQIARHGADQHRERHDALGELRHAEHRDLGEDHRGCVRPVGAAAHQFDVVDHRRERDYADERTDDGSEKSHAEVA